MALPKVAHFGASKKIFGLLFFDERNHYFLNDNNAGLFEMQKEMIETLKSGIKFWKRKQKARVSKSTFWSFHLHVNLKSSKIITHDFMSLFRRSQEVSGFRVISEILETMKKLKLKVLYFISNYFIFSKYCILFLS